VRAAVATELDSTKTVAATGREAGQQQRDPREEQMNQEQNKDPARDQAPHDVVADPASREVIYRERDVRAGNGQPLSDHALLRQRAYRAPYAASADAPLQPSDPHADIKA
jgi:hypothetical protein